jgi:antirestriction protein ArdC
MPQFTDLYDSITQQIISALEVGTPPWVCPWRRDPLEMSPRNAATARPYRGINVLLLNLRQMASGYAHNRWLTFQQARALDARIRRGEQGTTVVFFKLHEIAGNASDAPDTPDPERRRVIPLLRAFTVFNVDQTEGLALPSTLPEEPSWDACAAADALLAASGAKLSHGGARAFYQPAEDVIRLPTPGAFPSAADYYATALHELTHWTGHPARCNRLLGRRHGIDAYAFEELVAEMGAAFLTNHCGLQGGLQHASYIASWLTALRNDKRLIFAAASLAQRAADFVLTAKSGEPATQEATAYAQAV